MDREKKGQKHRKSKKFDTTKKFGVKIKSSQVQSSAIESLERRYKEIDPTKIKTLTDFPLSQNTQKGLQRSKFTTPTKIQQQSIGLALQGHDILGAAKTGSGKTLAFLIPVLESLYRQRWSPQDGLGALIISPTRELAYQIFEVLQKVGKFHDFSAGLVIGGKHVREEAERINTTNIVICTPGRLLQHMDETAYFNTDSLSVLVLDEADRILDLGFQKTMNAIIENLPKQRQTLLFSATQTKSVRDLARLSLKDPMYVSVHENAEHSTPSQLQQSYIVCNVEDKINLVWSFVKHHLKTKTLVFLASCKQVRFVYELFRRMRPGVPVMSLHGAMQQTKRMAVYDAFCRKQNAVLFATDIAARGLDFPEVNWVIQLDCPEDANTYIHRAGRTARYEMNGEALLILLPTEEEALISQLQAKKIPIEKIKLNPRKQRSIQGKIESMLAADVQLKEFAQRAFVAYLKSIFYMSNKAVFDVTSINLDTLSKSFGLAVTPRVRFIEREKKIRADRAKKKAGKDAEISDKVVKKTVSKDSSEEDSDSGEDSESSDDDESSASESETESESGDDKPGNKPGKSTKLRDTKGFGFGGVDDNDDFDDILKIKRKECFSDDDAKDDKNQESQGLSKKKDKLSSKMSKVAAAKKVLKKQLQVNTKVLFTEDGEEVVDVHKTQQTRIDDDEDLTEGGIDLDQAKRRLQEEDKFDKKLYREKIRKRHKEERLKEKEKRKAAKKAKLDEEAQVYLDNSGDEGDSNLDLIPDPDKVFGRKSGSDSGSEDDDGWNSADYSSDGSGPSTRQSYSREDSSEEDDESDDNSDSSGRDMDTGLSLADDESLALKLLTGS